MDLVWWRESLDACHDYFEDFQCHYFKMNYGTLYSLVVDCSTLYLTFQLVHFLICILCLTWSLILDSLEELQVSVTFIAKIVHL